MDNEFLDISTSYILQFGFGIGHVLNDVCASLWFTYFLVYFHLVLEFTATQSGNLMLVGQVVDALATPFVGYHSDHTNNFISARYGKRKIWHLFGTVCVLASFPFIFTNCIECSTTHKWAQMYYFAAFIVIFQIGWASVQISHLSLIPELSDDLHTRKHLTAVRYVLTVFSTLLVYMLAWVYLGFSVEAGTQQVGPSDSWKFSYLAYTVLVVGTIASLVFHLTITEKTSHLRQEQLTEGGSTAHCDILRTPVMYQVACIYMSTRLVVNISQVLIPLYLHRTLLLGTRSLALVPFTMYMGSLAAAWVQRVAPRSMTRKYSYLVGAGCALGGFMWIYFGSFMAHMDGFIYLIAILIGFGGAVMLVTSLALAADLVGEKTEASAFVYGLMSFTDKLACGVAIAVIQMYAECAEKTYYRDALGWVCGSAATVGLVCTLLLPKFTTDALQDQNTLINDQTAEEETLAPDDV